MPTNDTSKLIKQINDNESLTDILIQCEDFLDSLDMYAFRNWFKGEVVGGPFVKRYWITIQLRYDYNDIPDPSGGYRLFKHGCLIKYKKAFELRPINPKKETEKSLRNKQAGQEETNTLNRKVGDTETEIISQHMQFTNTMTGKPKMKKHCIWIVEIAIPRKFIKEI